MDFGGHGRHLASHVLQDTTECSHCADVWIHAHSRGMLCSSLNRLLLRALMLLLHFFRKTALCVYCGEEQSADTRTQGTGQGTYHHRSRNGHGFRNDSVLLQRTCNGFYSPRPHVFTSVRCVSFYTSCISVVIQLPAVESTMKKPWQFGSLMDISYLIITTLYLGRS